MPINRRKHLSLPLFLSFPSLSSFTHPPPTIPEPEPEPETEEISTAYSSHTIPASSVDEAYAALARLYALALSRCAPQAIRAHLDEYASALAELEGAGVTLCPYERGAILAGSLPERMSARLAWETVSQPMGWADDRSATSTSRARAASVSRRRGRGRGHRRPSTRRGMPASWLRARLRSLWTSRVVQGIFWTFKIGGVMPMGMKRGCC